MPPWAGNAAAAVRQRTGLLGLFTVWLPVVPPLLLWQANYHAGNVSSGLRAPLAAPGTAPPPTPVDGVEAVTVPTPPPQPASVPVHVVVAGETTAAVAELVRLGTAPCAVARDHHDGLVTTTTQLGRAPTFPVRCRSDLSALANELGSMTVPPSLPRWLGLVEAKSGSQLYADASGHTTHLKKQMFAEDTEWFSASKRLPAGKCSGCRMWEGGKFDWLHVST